MSADDYSRLVQAYKSTEGYSIYWKIEAIGMSHRVFLGNHNELVRRIHTGMKLSDVAHIVGSGHRKELEEEFCEITRLLHNYVAAIKSLVDHTRRTANRLLDSESQQVYHDRVEVEFKRDQTTAFLHDLRNYFLHVAHPSVSLVIQSRGEGFVVEYRLTPNELMQWEGWRRPSVDMMNHFKEGIPLGALVEDYERKVYRFYSWLIDYLYSVRNSELEEFWTKHHEWANFCRSHGIPITDEEMRKYIDGHAT